MSTALLQRELDDLVLRLKGLVLVRALLESRGASAAELAAHSEEIARVRAELAQLVKGSRDGAAAFDASAPVRGGDFTAEASAYVGSGGQRR